MNRLSVRSMPVMHARRAAAIWCVLAALACAVLMASLALGSVPLTPSRVFAALTALPSHSGAPADLAQEIVR
jgi:iron complex transport system permease protein